MKSLIGAIVPLSLAAEPDLDRFLADWAKAMEGLETLEIRFAQEKRLKILRRPLLSTGTIRLRLKDGRLRSTVLDPAGKVDTEILVDKDSVRLFYPSLRRVEVFDLAAGAAPPVAFPGLGGDVAALKRDYELSLERSAGGDRLTLRPRDPGAPVEEMALVLRDFQPRELIQLDRTGGSVRLVIEEFQKNAPLGEKDLDLIVPPGTETTRPLGKKPG